MKLKTLLTAQIAMLSLTLTGSIAWAGSSSPLTFGSTKNAALVVTPRADKTNMKDGQPLTEKMIKAADSYNDYTFEFEMTAYKGGTTVERGKFYFKKPRLIRLEEHGPLRKGSVAILTASGKVKGHAGGGLSFFVVDLSPNSSLLRSANGYPMVDSDLFSLAKALKKFVDEGKVALQAENQTTLANGNRVEMLEVYMKNDGPIYKRVAVDADTLLPVEWWDYEQGNLVSHSTWHNFAGNIGLTDATFTIKGAAK